MTLPTNRNLEEIFDIAATEPPATDLAEPVTDALASLPDTMAALDKIELALPAVRGLEASDSEMDALATKATESFDDLMNLGMQVDSRYASEIFAVAGAMLGHAITAKTAKINKKLKIIDLQLKKARLDQIKEPEEEVPTAQGRVLSRNDLLRTLTGRDDENTSADK
jgi:hypothetical protein